MGTLLENFHGHLSISCRICFLSKKSSRELIFFDFHAHFSKLKSCGKKLQTNAKTNSLVFAVNLNTRKSGFAWIIVVLAAPPSKLQNFQNLDGNLSEDCQNLGEPLTVKSEICIIRRENKVFFVGGR